MQSSKPTRDGSVDALNELLRGELSAVESYDRALPAVQDKPALRSDLQECRASHEVRVEKIRRVIIDVGGQPARASGAWGLFAKATATGARALGWKAVISALEEGEDHGLKEYDDALARIDEQVRPLVAGELYQAQQHTHSVMSAIRRGVHA
ncbi:MAG TPA: DUF2383 domain-containing protein [Polyangia bacterium]|jgi:hypothetical protein|nr:DUF2383 domain-containing protein [Polyangia bacterium]